MLARVFLKQHVRQRIPLCGPLLASELATVATELEGNCSGARQGQAGALGTDALAPDGGSTYFVTTLIFTPKTPVCFLDGVLFRLMSRLVNFMENSTLICLGVRQGVSARGVLPNLGTPRRDCKQSPPLAPKAPDILVGWEREGCRGRRGRGWAEGQDSTRRTPGRGRAAHPLCRHFLSLQLTPFISITSVCQFLVSTVCGSNCEERKDTSEREMTARDPARLLCCSATAHKLAKWSGRQERGLRLIRKSTLQGGFSLQPPPPPPPPRPG